MYLIKRDLLFHKYSIMIVKSWRLFNLELNYRNVGVAFCLTMCIYLCPHSFELTVFFVCLKSKLYEIGFSCFVKGFQVLLHLETLNFLSNSTFCRHFFLGIHEVLKMTSIKTRTGFSAITAQHFQSSSLETCSKHKIKIYVVHSI